MLCLHRSLSPDAFIWLMQILKYNIEALNSSSAVIGCHLKNNSNPYKSEEPTIRYIKPITLQVTHSVISVRYWQYTNVFGCCNIISLIHCLLSPAPFL